MYKATNYVWSSIEDTFQSSCYICFFWYEHIEEIWPIILLFSSYMLHVKDSYFLNCGCLPPTVNSSETEIIKV